MKNRLLLIMSALVLSVGTTYGATAAKGVFTVNAQGKKVQFANANSVYSKKELIQWSHLQDAVSPFGYRLIVDVFCYLFDDDSA